MSFKIAQGLFEYDFTDHYAILGVALDASGNDIRKRYMQIARRLHPDSCKAETQEGKKLASDLFSKLVNPAYTKLSADNQRMEYGVVLRKMGERLAQEKDKIHLTFAPAQQLLEAQDLDASYAKSLQELAKTQYESFENTLHVIGEISQLNLVYLLRKQLAGGTTPKRQPAPAAAPAVPAAAPAVPATPKPAAASSKVDSYYRRAQDAMAAGNLTLAVIELKEALKVEPKNSSCHGLLGMVYLKQNQVTLAKVHINQALKLNPQESVALEAQKTLEAPAKPAASNNTKAKPGKDDKKSGGGFFGGLFGGKK